MKLYELLDIVGKAMLGVKDGCILAEKLKETVDDNGDFLRNRYCKRKEGLVVNRKLGEINYILFAYDDIITKEFLERVEVVNCQISWVDKDVNSFDDEIQWILQFGYSKVLVIVADNYRITVRGCEYYENN